MKKRSKSRSDNSAWFIISSGWSRDSHGLFFNIRPFKTIRVMPLVTLSLIIAYEVRPRISVRAIRYLRTSSRTVSTRTTRERFTPVSVYQRCVRVYERRHASDRFYDRKEKKEIARQSGSDVTRGCRRYLPLLVFALTVARITVTCVIINKNRKQRIGEYILMFRENGLMTPGPACEVRTAWYYSPGSGVGWERGTRV